MISKGLIKKGEYFDSVTLMRASRKINSVDGVIDSAVVMGTNENKSILKSAGLLLNEFEKTDDTDLLIAVSAKSEEIADKILFDADAVLKSLRKTSESAEERSFGSLSNAIKNLPGANLALISIAGKYAGDEAMKALQSGLHVMLFSDNVLLEKEIELKKYAAERELLVMGPDCGTAIINGIPLAFANIVNRGEIGIVAAAGTGLQETSCLISNLGGGISQAIGVGGRDVKKDVGGIMFIRAIDLLLKDDNTKAILLVSKPPHHEVLVKIASAIKGSTKPVISVFLNANSDEIRQYGIIPAETLEEGARKAVCAASGLAFSVVDEYIVNQNTLLKSEADKIKARLTKKQKYIRGLFSGGTFCSEAQIILSNSEAEIFSNAPTANSKEIGDPLVSRKHTIIDLGDDVFTVGRPHPMIDFSLRNDRIVAEASDAETAIILLDIVLGYGSTMTPVEDISPAIKKAMEISGKEKRYLPIIASVTGTDSDPQNRGKVVSALSEMGIIIAESNAAASRLAGMIIK